MLEARSFWKSCSVESFPFNFLRLEAQPKTSPCRFLQSSISFIGPAEAEKQTQTLWSETEQLKSWSWELGIQAGFLDNYPRTFTPDNYSLMPTISVSK